MLGLHWQGPGSGRLPHALARRPLERLAARPTPTPAPTRASAELRIPAGTTATSTGRRRRTASSSARAGRVTRLRAYYLWSHAAAAAAQPLRTLSVAGSPSIVPRSSWEADEKITARGRTIAPSLKLAVVHHTAGTNLHARPGGGDRARDRGLPRAGETAGTTSATTSSSTASAPSTRAGRRDDANVIGAHALGFNTGTVGVALIGNFTAASPPPAMEAALVRLLAWRLDLAHVDPARHRRLPLGRQPQVQGRQGRHAAGDLGSPRHRPDRVPRQRVYALLPSIARRVAATGLPKLYAPAVSGLVGGRVRFHGPLSSALPWTVTVTNATGRIVARRTGVSADVDWTWGSTPAALAIPIAEPLRWTIDAGGAVLPASGRSGRRPAAGRRALAAAGQAAAVVPVPRPVKPPAVVPLPRPAKPPPVVPVPRPVKPPAVTTPGRRRYRRPHPRRPPPRRRPPRPPTCSPA